MDKIIETIVSHLGNDKDKIADFLKDPMKLIKDLNLDIKQDQLEDIVKAVKAKVNTEDLLSKGKDLLGGLEHMFKK